MKKIELYSGMKLRKPTSFVGVYDEITLVSKFNKGWLVSRSNSLTGNAKEFVYAEKYITDTYKQF